MPTPLSATTLDAITKAAVPRYDRGALAPGIVHFGVGNFHRAHQASYLDRLFAAGRDHDFAIVGAGVVAPDAAMRDALAQQDWLTTLVEQSAEASEARVIGPMIDFAPVGDAAAILARLTSPTTRIVSLTVTEGGYFIDAEGAFDPNHPAIAADAANPEEPRTAFGLIGTACRRRRELGLSPFTVMSCDNIPPNGVVTKNAVAGLARLHEPPLADFIEAEVAFPNGMVDRITPATGERERALVASEFDIADTAPVFCEDFTQWVLEDTFLAGRPALEEVGVAFVADVTPYEVMKIRMLNGGHALIGYPAALLGLTYVHEAMEHPLVAAYLDKVTHEEIIPVVPTVPGTDPSSYAALLARRFANPKIGDTTRRLAFDGSNRQPKFIVPTISDRLTDGAPIVGLALGSALWCRYCAGTTEAGEAIAANDPRWETLKAAALAARTDPGSWLDMSEVYGAVGRAQSLRQDFARALASLYDVGTEATLQRFLDGAL